MFGERRRRLNNDYEKDEQKILDEMYKAFRLELRMTREEVEDFRKIKIQGLTSAIVYYARFLEMKY